MTARQKRLLKKDLIGWLFMLVPLVLFVVYIVVPLVMSVYLSFTNYNLLTLKWVGAKQYVSLFTVPAMRTDLLISLRNVLFYTVLAVPLTIIPPFIVAAMLHNNLKGAKAFRVLLYIPGLTGSVAMALIWNWFFNVNYSPINAVIRALGLPAFPFLDSPDTAMVTLVLMVAWSSLGGGTVLYTAALQMIPGDFYEAAKLDGAGSVKQFLHITVPMLAPTTYFQFTMGIIGALQLFDPVYLLTNGGPQKATQTPGYLIYTFSFNTTRSAGLGCAIAMVFFFVVMAVTFLFQKFTKEQYI